MVYWSCLPLGLEYLVKDVSSSLSPRNSPFSSLDEISVSASRLLCRSLSSMGVPKRTVRRCPAAGELRVGKRTKDQGFLPKSRKKIQNKGGASRSGSS